MIRKILIIHTGGTISMFRDPDTDSVKESVSNPMANFMPKNVEGVEFIVEEPFSLPSPHITTQHMLQIKALIETAVSQFELTGIVITHGTDTLEETAYFLDLTVQTDIPIVLTGAMRSSNEIGADGLANFLASIRVALDPIAHGKGVLIVMNEEIHAAKNATKSHTSNLATFLSPQFGPIGTITKQRILFHNQPLTKEKYIVDEISHNVFLIKAHLGMDSTLFELLLTTSVDGLIIEALGQGNLPPETINGIKALLKKNIPIILVSRCLNGFIEDNYDYFGGGKHLKKLGIIFSNGLNGQKARIKLLVALAHKDTCLDLKKIFSL